MNFFQKAAAIWQNISLVQRALLTAIVLTLVVAGGLLSHWATKPEMRLLYQDISAEEASKITEKISEKGTPYELKNGGTAIYAPKEQIYQLRLDMAKDGLPTGEQGGYKIFDNEKIGISPFVQSVNLKRALEEELAKSIQMIDEVVYARLHIVDTKESLFKPEGGNTTASVVLKVKAGYRLSALTVAAITHLVSASVEGLRTENVTVIDSQGRLLSGESDQLTAGGAGTVQDYKERVEQNLASKAEEMLTAVLGPGRATVKVSAIVDMNSVNLVTETYDPTKKVATKEEIKSNSETEGDTAAGEGKPTIPGGTKKDETVVTEYVVAKTMEQKVVLPGEIKSLSVAAFVDLSAPAPADTADANEGETSSEGTPIMAKSDVEAIIKNALGLKETDSLTVVDVKFHQPTELLGDEEEKGGLNYTAIAKQASLGIMAICVLLALKILGGAKQKTAAAAPAGGAEQLAAGGAPAGLLVSETRGGESIMLRRQIASALQNNPEQARELFSNWLSEKKV